MALIFTGTQRAYRATVTVTTTMSITLWVKGSPNAFSRHCETTAYNLTPSADGSCAFNRITNATNGNWQCSVANNGMTVADWNHIAWTYDGGSLSNAPIFYANAVAKTLSASTQPTGTLNMTFDQLEIGNRADAARPFGGAIGYFCLHNVVLTPGEIHQSMRFGSTPRGLVEFWPMLSALSIEPGYAGNAHGLTLDASAPTLATTNPPVVPSFLRSSLTRALGGAAVAVSTGQKNLPLMGVG